jgi:aldehyde dehydrogenase (NAD+)
MDGVDMTGCDGRMLIDGQLVEAAERRRYVKFSPATGQPLGDVADAGPADVRAAVGAARRAFDETDWSTNHAFRQRCLRQLQDALREEADHFRDVQIAEAGVTVGTSAGLVKNVTDGMSFMIDMAASYPYARSHGRSTGAQPVYERVVHKRPHGVAGLITVW